MEQRKAKGPQTYLLIDANSKVGGSASSVISGEGFVFDYGGHILYPHEEYAEFIALLDKLVDAWHESVPKRGVWIDNRLIPYPVQRNIHRLPPRKMISALQGLSGLSLSRQLRAPRLTPADDLERHLQQRFGRGLTEHVLTPLNQKMWAHHPAQLGTSWTAHRSGSRVPNVADTSVRQILRSLITGRDNPGWSESTRVRYPLRGGTGAIWTSLHNQLPKDAVMGGTRVVQVDPTTRTVLLDDGKRISYGHLVSSVPLDQLLGLLAHNPLPELVAGLRMAHAAFIGLGLKGVPPALLAGVHSFHMPEKDIPCWRVSFPKSLSPHNVPPGPYWSILCEISYPPGSVFDFDKAQQATISQLRRRHIIPPDNDVVSVWLSDMRYGYPVPFIGRDEILRKVQNMLQAIGVLSRGRFGGWKYEVSNQDHAFMQGVEAVRLIRDGTRETTYHFDAA